MKKKFSIENDLSDTKMKSGSKFSVFESDEDSYSDLGFAKKQTKKDTHKVYSFWANKEQIEVWKCYQEANSDLEKAEDLGLKAIQEYIENHPLSDDELTMYELKLKAKGLENSSYA